MTDGTTQSMAAGDAGVVVGIDLGTTNSLVAIADARGPRVLAPAGASALVPSVVRYEDDGVGGVRRVVGTAAADAAVEFPRTTVSSVKRLMGRSVRDAAADAGYLSYAVVEGAHDTARVALPVWSDRGPLVLSPQEVSAAILTELRARAEAVLGVPVRKAVVTVPAYFDDAQRQATRDAGRIAGLEVVRIVNEPTAAALAYGLGLPRDAARNAGARTVAVYDLGGGTFDISILRLTPAEGEGGVDFFQVLATAGDTHLGGDDVDHLLVELFLREMGDVGARGPGEGEERGGSARRAGLPQDPESARRADLPKSMMKALVNFARAVKHRLSDAESAAVRIDLGGGRVYERAVTRAELEALIAPWVQRTVAACERARRDAAKQPGGAEIDTVVLVGGSTRIPCVRARVEQVFGVKPYTALDPDLVVALGAAVQASILRGGAEDQRGALLLDVVPLSLGIETRGGAAAKLIPRNSAVPARATEMFSTSVDGQVSIKLNVVQGEREMAADCRSLGEFHLKGLPPMPAGVPQVEVEFLVDANGVLRVSAHERRSGKRAELQVIPNHGLTADEVDRMEAESYAHAREDMTRHRVVDLVTNGRMDVKWIRDGLSKHGAMLDAAYRADLEAKVARLVAMCDAAEADWRSVDPNSLHAAKDELDRGSVRLQEVGISQSLRGG